MIHFHESKKLLPILERSHWPQLRQFHVYPTPLHTERDHDEMVETHPEYFIPDPDALPYAAFIQKDGAQFLVDYDYLPMWWRPCNYSHAGPCAPTEWLDWVAVYWLHDHSLLPKNSAHLREILALAEQEFVDGGGLWVRRWKPKPEPEPKYAGMLVASYPIPPRPKNNVTPFRAK
jgi:hypothetical protein